MPLYEVKKGHIPEVSFGDKPQVGWLRVGPETDKLWSFSATGHLGDFCSLSRIVVNSSHVSFRPDLRARMPDRSVFYGEDPIEFHGIIPVDEYSFHDVAVSGLLYRSGLYRGAVSVEGAGSLQQLADMQEVLVNTHPHTFEAKLSR